MRLQGFEAMGAIVRRRDSFELKSEVPANADPQTEFLGVFSRWA